MGRLKRAGMPLAGAAITALVILLLSGCAPEEPDAGNDRLGIIVTIPPQAEFVTRVGGDRVEVTVMVPPGMSPHTYEPSPGQLQDLTRAVMYAKVGSGVEFELVWMDRLIEINRDMLVVDCAAGVTLRAMTASEEHDAEDTAGHSTTDPHIWMSPFNARLMVQNIRDGLIVINPANQAYYEENCAAYLVELDEIDREARQSLSGATNRAFMTYHPAFGYLALDYNLTMLPIEEEGKEPTPAGLAYLISQAKEHDIKAVFASPQFNPESAEVIANAINGRVILIDPLAGDYSTNLATLLEKITAALE